MSIEIQKYPSDKIRGVICPDCGACGGSKYPCWCHYCHKLGRKVMMLPSINKSIIGSWSEVIK